MEQTQAFGLCSNRIAFGYRLVIVTAFFLENIKRTVNDAFGYGFLTVDTSGC
jgi:hypothetical protein